jgi:hypothetical protein
MMADDLTFGKSAGLVMITDPSRDLHDIRAPLLRLLALHKQPLCLGNTQGAHALILRQDKRATC